MPRHAAFLRAINLGRNRRVGSADLRACFESAGLDEVQTFRTSGNVVFEAGRKPREQLTGEIERALADALGYDVDVFLRTADEVRAIAAHRPFADGLVQASAGKLQVWLLSAKPTARKREEVLALATGADRLAFGERELYWLPSGGTMESELDQKAIGKLAGPSTMRTKGTIEQLAAKFFAD
jgi:uncharacterized protein (DUF1697 family)